MKSLKLNIQTDFLNLSACETGLGKIYQGEGVVGLTQSFFVAGANSISVSLWQVSDESTVAFMLNFYKDLNLKSENYSETLNEIKKKIHKR